MHYEVGSEADVLLFQASGVIDSVSFDDWEVAVRARAGRRIPTGVLLDLRLIEYDGTLLELRSYAKKLGRYDQTKIAIVMHEGYDFGLARAALLLARLTPGKHRVFRHVCNARQWVGLPIGARPRFWRYRCTCAACSQPILATCRSPSLGVH